MAYTRQLVILAFSVLGLVAAAAAGETDPSLVVTKVGEQAPDFTAMTADGEEISLANYKGKVVLLNFFATWCPPCRRELPHLETEVWTRLKDKGLIVLAVGREHDATELKQFKDSEHLTLPVVADPKRQVYAKFAKRIIPRNFVIGKSGKVIYERAGFKPEEFAKMVKLIEKELDQPQG